MPKVNKISSWLPFLEHPDLPLGQTVMVKKNQIFEKHRKNEMNYVVFNQWPHLQELKWPWKMPIFNTKSSFWATFSNSVGIFFSQELWIIRKFGMFITYMCGDVTDMFIFPRSYLISNKGAWNSMFLGAKP